MIVTKSRPRSKSEETAMEKRTTTPHEESLLESLISRGWCFRSRDEALQLIKRVVASTPEDERHIAEKGGILDLVESELLSMDLRSFGERAIPDVTTLKKSSYLFGPKVLQVVSVRDIYHSCIDASLRTSQHSRRLLRFVLTDGNGEVTAIEYVPVPTIKNEIVPGTKVRLENRIAIHNGILCLDAKTMTLLGGMVRSLFEEWKMDQKYSGISRSTSKPSNNNEETGPPPFEKLRVDRHSHKKPQQCGLHRHSGLPDSVIKLSNIDGRRGLASPSSQTGNTGVASTSRKNEETQSTTNTRPKEVVEVVPIQNQAASQKLLQKMNQENHQDGHYKGNRQRGKYREEVPVFTLDEWERRKTGAPKPTLGSESSDVNHDEELAWQLQRQLDLEDSHVHHGQQTEAEKIRMSMFSFERGEERNDERRGGRRGRGRGRVRGRGRGGRNFH